jgi:phosphoribosylformylglycinamidine synthase
MACNASGKFESAFLNVDIPEATKALMFQGLQGARLGIWVAHGEGRFRLPKMKADHWDIALKYTAADYPANPNGSDFDAAGIVSRDGRHLAMMPHLERAIFPWQWAYYPYELRQKHQKSPWLDAFINARKWIEARQ